MGNYCGSTSSTSTLSTRDEKDGTPPGVNPAVLLDICYWEGETSTDIEAAEEGVAVAAPNYDDIATSIHSV